MIENKQIIFTNFNLLNDDEYFNILSFLNLATLCKIACVSKHSRFSKKSNDDLFWKDFYKNKIIEYFENLKVYIRRKGFCPITKEQEEEKNLFLQRNKDYKNGFIEFIYLINKKVERMMKNKNIKCKNKNKILMSEELLFTNLNSLIDVSKPLKENLKVRFYGKYNSGKTCMLIVLDTNETKIKEAEYIPAQYDDFAVRVYINSLKQTFMLTFEDSPNPEEYNNYTYGRIDPDTDLFVLCFSVADPIDFQNLDQ
ncbi:hypothetical protein ABK040_011634 [Willaertia magna]